MRILLATNHLRVVGGSETWTFTMAREMMKRKFDVDVFTLQPGALANLLRDKIRINPKLKKEYDLILVNHNTSLNHIRKAGIKGFKILVCHGIHMELEQPTKGADRYVAISEEVSQHLEDKGFENTIIRNPVDCEKFKPVLPISQGEPNSVLMMSNSTAGVHLARKACEQLNLRFTFVSMHYPRFDIENLINFVDLVVSLGRGCYESMACGRNVIIFDQRYYMEGNSEEGLADGLVTPQSIGKFVWNNCSGRTMNMRWGVEELKTGIMQYDSSFGISNRQFVLENLHVEKIADEYLKLYRARR